MHNRSPTDSCRTAIETLQRLLKVCSVQIRLEILLQLVRREMDVASLAKCLGLEGSHVSHHLRYLREAWLVEVRQEGHCRVYRLGPPVQVLVTADMITLRIKDESGPELTLVLPDTGSATAPMPPSRTVPGFAPEDCTQAGRTSRCPEALPIV